MRSYNYTLLILISLGLTLTGCTSMPEKAATNRNDTAVGATDGPELVKSDPMMVRSEVGKAITVYKSPTCGC